jgi:hypothetical protein
MWLLVKPGSDFAAVAFMHALGDMTTSTRQSMSQADADRTDEGVADLEGARTDVGTMDRAAL